MRILIVNDDGINAPGLTVAEEIAAEVGGPNAEIWVVAPAVEKSGASHCVSYTTPMRVIEMGERRFAIEGYPADCAIAGVRDLMPNAPDLLLSGVNRGHNVAEDAVYSGTVAGAKEGSIQGIKSISLSQYFSAREGDLFDAARVHGAEAVRRALALWPSALACRVSQLRWSPRGEQSARRRSVGDAHGERRGWPGASRAHAEYPGGAVGVAEL